MPVAREQISDASSDEEVAPSIQDDPSQVCFLLHTGASKPSLGSSEQSPKKSTPPQKRKRAANRDSLQCLPPCFTDEPRECGVWRMEAFQATWKSIEESIKDVFEVQNMKAFKEIQKFVHDTLFCDAQLELYLSPKTSKPGSAFESARVSKQLHAALLHLRNVDSSDHTKTFVQLKAYLKKNNCHVANLLPHNFSSKTGVGGALHSMIKQIAGFTPDTADMDVLASWHRDTSNVKSPIVIIIDDAELCSSMVLADFIVILSEWIPVLPLVLIMGMATSGEVIKKRLPASAARHLHAHTFLLPSPNEYLEAIIKEVLLKPFPSFTLGLDALRFLLSHYQKYDSTVTSFLRALKMACMEHFLSQPLSFLCASLPNISFQADVGEASNILKGTLLQFATSLPSVQSKQFGSDGDVGREMATALSNLREQKERWCTSLHCLLTASESFGTDSVKIFLEILERHAHNTNCTSHKLSLMNGDAMRFGHCDSSSTTSILLKKIRDAPDQILHKMLTKWIQLIESLKECKSEVQDLLHKLTAENSLVSRIEDLSDGVNGSLRRKQILSSLEDNLEEDQGNMTSNAEVCGNNSRGKEISVECATVDLEMEHLNANRMVGTSAMQKKLVSKVHGKMAAHLLERMTRHLISLESLPFHEILCFRNVAAIKRVLVGEPRRQIQNHVEHPGTTLKCECCCLPGSDPLACMNDTSILFRLAHKQGDQANLFDLYQAFDAIIRLLVGEKQAKNRKGQKSPKKVVHDEVDSRTLVQARFCKAASELQLVGLFRMPSKKRSDSVQLAI